jgi:hypothetical protein
MGGSVRENEQPFEGGSGRQPGAGGRCRYSRVTTALSNPGGPMRPLQDRWTVDQAIAARATVIYLEDLRSMEAGGMGRTHNTRTSQTVRGQIAAPNAAPRRRSRNRRGHGAAPQHLEALPWLPHSAAAPQSPRPTHGERLEVGHLPQRGVRLAGRPRPGRLAPDRSTRPGPPDQDRRGQDQRHHGDPQGRRQARSEGGRHRRTEGQPEGPVQDRSHPATHQPPRAQATRGSLPHQALRPGGQASGGTRTNGPDPAAPRSPPAPGGAHDQHTHHRPQAARGSTGRGIPPARSRFPTQVGRTHTGPYGPHRIA